MQDDYLYALQQLRDQLPYAFTAVLGGLANLLAGPVPIIAVVIVYWSVSKRYGYFLMTSVLASCYLSQLLKNIACVYRPWITDTRLHVADIAVESASGYSFPSVHSTVAAAVCGATAVITWKKHRGWAVAAIAVALLVMFSRNYLGCHSLIDVLAGAAIGVIGIAATWAAITYMDRHPKADIPIAITGIIMAAIILVFVTVKDYPLDYDAAGSLLADPWEMQTDCYRFAGAIIGLLISWVIERRFVSFSIDVSKRTRILRAVVGTVAVLVLYVGVLPALGNVFDAHWCYFFKYFILMLTLLAAYPACFTWYERRKSAKS